MEDKKEPKVMKMSLWTFYVLVASLVMLLAATVSGWLLVAKLDKQQKNENLNNAAIVNNIK